MSATVPSSSESALLPSSSYSDLSQSPPIPKATGAHSVPGESSIFLKRETAGRLREMQSYLVGDILLPKLVQVLILDGSDVTR
jgi:hypothetical protein